MKNRETYKVRLHDGREFIETATCAFDARRRCLTRPEIEESDVTTVERYICRDVYDTAAARIKEIMERIF